MTVLIHLSSYITSSSFSHNHVCHLILLGTEFFDGKLSRYVDFPVTDVLQMMGRAGRPQFDKEGVAVIMCEESKKSFLKKFLYEPFPVESCLGERMCETINAEVSIGTINSLSDAIGYLQWTFYARRVKLNPSYYGAKSSNEDDLEDFFLSVVQETTEKLRDHGCVSVKKSEGTESFITTTHLGRAASNFYVNYQTPKQMIQGSRGLKQVLAQHSQEPKCRAGLQKQKFVVGNAASMKRVGSIYKFSPQHAMYTFAIAKILFELSFTHEFNELPVRHNEEELNLELSRSLPWGYDLSKVSWWTDKQKHPGKNILDIMADPHTKCFLLVQAFIFKVKLPISDYINDMRSVVEQIPRLLACMQFTALDDKTSAGNFEMFSCFPLVRRIIRTGVMIDAKPSFASHSPSIKFGDFKVEKELKKGSYQHKGMLDFDYNIDLNSVRNKYQRRPTGKNGGLGVTLVLGSLEGGYLLDQSSFNIPEFKKEKWWKKHIRMNFDWNTAESNAGQDQNLVVVRVLHEFTSDLDFEIMVTLKC